MIDTMSKLLEAGLTDAEVIAGVTTNPRAAIGLPAAGFLQPGAMADLTLFSLENASLAVPDSSGGLTTLKRLYTPHFAVRGVHSAVCAPRRPVAIAGRTS